MHVCVMLGTMIVVLVSSVWDAIAIVCHAWVRLTTTVLHVLVAMC